MAMTMPSRHCSQSLNRWYPVPKSWYPINFNSGSDPRYILHDEMYPGSDPQRQFGGWMKKIAVVGLGYVGLPLAVAFGEKREVVGFDINAGRIAELKDGVDFTREVSREELAAASKLSFTDSLDGIADCQVYIVTVPTPIDEFKTPDLTPLVKASESGGKVLRSEERR